MPRHYKGVKTQIPKYITSRTHPPQQFPNLGKDWLNWLVLEKNMKAKLCNEVEVRVPADDIWEVYGTTKLQKIVHEVAPSFIESVEFIEGDGGVGTVVKIVLPQGTPHLFTCFKEKFIKIDEEKRFKEAEMVEGGYLDHGFSFYKVSVEIISKNEQSSIIKSTITYELDDEEFASNASFVSIKPQEAIAIAIGEYLVNKQYK